MKKVYPSKISYGLLIIIFCVLFGPFLPDLFLGNSSKNLWIFLLFISLLFVLILFLFLKTRYIINGNQLKISFGFIHYKPIDIQSITEINNSKSILSSPAPSFDRIEIKYGKFNEVLISPKDKVGFAAELSKINPSIRNTITS